MIGIKKVICLTLAVGMLLSATACQKKNVDPNVKATVNGQIITNEEFDKAWSGYKQNVETQPGFTQDMWSQPIDDKQTTYEQYFKDLILDNMILEILLVEKAKQEGLSVDDEKVTEQLNVFKGYFKTDEEYQDYLKTNGMTEDYYKETLKKQLIINDFIDKKIEQLNPTDDELKVLYDKEKENMKQIQASHILVDTEEEANEVIKRIQANEKFEDLAMALSKDTGSASVGGDVGYMTKGSNFVPEFLDAAFKLQVGEVSGPVKTDYGYHIIKITNSKETFEQLKEGGSLLEAYKSSEYSKLLEELEKSAKIEKFEKE